MAAALLRCVQEFLRHTFVNAIIRTHAPIRTFSCSKRRSVAVQLCERQCSGHLPKAIDIVVLCMPGLDGSHGH
eukprot:1778822-Amphidinium_carterae.1